MQKKCKTINSRDSLVVTHPTTSLPAHVLRTAERTGSPVFHALWSIARGIGAEVVLVQSFIDKKPYGEVVHSEGT
jgi:hypothetical protein